MPSKTLDIINKRLLRRSEWFLEQYLAKEAVLRVGGC